VCGPAHIRKERAAGNVCASRCWQHTDWECVGFGHFCAEGRFILHASCVLTCMWMLFISRIIILTMVFELSKFVT
jgi:hypothetical protein